MPSPEISIVIPTYREAANLPVLVPRIAAAMQRLGRPYEILVVDDNSADGTERIVPELSRQCPVQLLIRYDPRDLSQAALAGLRQARGRILAVMDADLSHPPEAIPDLIAALDRGPTDFVIGSRFVKGGSTAGWARRRRLNSYVATLLARPLAPGVADPMSGFFSLTRETLDRARALDPIGYKIGLELLRRCHCRQVVEVPIAFPDRACGESKLSLEQQARYLIHLNRLYRDYRRGWGCVLRPIIWVMLRVIRGLQRVAGRGSKSMRSA